jgi:hypothetical protein
MLPLSIFVEFFLDFRKGKEEKREGEKERS